MRAVHHYSAVGAALALAVAVPPEGSAHAAVVEGSRTLQAPVSLHAGVPDLVEGIAALEAGARSAAAACRCWEGVGSAGRLLAVVEGSVALARGSRSGLVGLEGGVSVRLWGYEAKEDD